jgi:hypothetical protein
MDTERYAHILDDDRRVNAVRFQKEFYGGNEPQGAEEPQIAPTTQVEPVAEQPSTQQIDPLQNLDATAKQQLLFKLLADSPDMSALLMSLAGKGA